jgi:soluble lytic murein transglycosylase-like protein
MFGYAPITATLVILFTCSFNQVSTAGTDSNVCEQFLSAASSDENVPLGVLYAVGLTETGNKGSLHPYALNIEGKTVFASTKAEAMGHFRKARHDGKRLIDLGCMQVNHHYHGSKFKSPETMLDPQTNIKYAARFLKDLYTSEGSWTAAVARYHASPRNKTAQRRYICSVIRNLVASDFGKWTPESRSFCKVKPR